MLVSARLQALTASVLYRLPQLCQMGKEKDAKKSISSKDKDSRLMDKIKQDAIDELVNMLYLHYVRTVRFGRKPVSGPAGRMVDHWAIQVGEGWWEVAGPEDDGHIRPRPVFVSLSDGLSVGVDIVAEYNISHCLGDQAASGAVPSFVKRSFSGHILALLLIGGSVIMVWGWMGGQNDMLSLCMTLVRWLLVFVFGSWAMMKMIPEQYGGLLYATLYDLLFQIGMVKGIYKIIARAAEQMAWPGLAGIALLVIYSFGWIAHVYALWLHGNNWWCGEYDDPRLGSVLGTTIRTDQQIMEFNAEFLRNHPEYKGLTVNCQWYAEELVTFLMKAGERKRNLPNQESPFTRDNMLKIGRGSVAIVVISIFSYYVLND